MSDFDKMPPEKMPEWLDKLVQLILDEAIISNYPVTYDISWMEPEDPTAICWWQITIWPAVGKFEGKNFHENGISVSVDTLMDLLAGVDPEYRKATHVTVTSVQAILEVPSRSAKGNEAVVFVVYFEPKEDSEPIYEVLNADTCCYQEIETGKKHNIPEPELN